MSTVPPFQSDISAAKSDPKDYLAISGVDFDSSMQPCDCSRIVEPCVAAVTRSPGGVFCNNPGVISCEKSMMEYILHYLREKPAFYVIISGSHTEMSHPSHSSALNSGRNITNIDNIDGDACSSVNVDKHQNNSFQSTHHHHHHHQHKNPSPNHGFEKVIDFEVEIDVSHLINGQWSLIHAVPTSECHFSESNGSFQSLVCEFVQSTAKHKKLVVQKQIVGWNLPQLESTLKSLAKSCGYRGKVTVEFKRANGDIVAKSKSIFDNPCFIFLIFITFAWILVLPIYGIRYCCRRKFNGKAYALFPMLVTDEQFYYANASSITNAIFSRRKVRFQSA